MIVKIGPDVTIRAYKNQYKQVRVVIHAPKDLIIERIYLPDEQKGQEFYSKDDESSQIKCPIIEKRK